MTTCDWRRRKFGRIREICVQRNDLERAWEVVWPGDVPEGEDLAFRSTVYDFMLDAIEAERVRRAASRT